ncbi:MAG: hypothetical protein PWQ10_664 [Patescibacteria group bacterium]|nr:hypothetical protein [Patescibacteria group bacterium]
MKENSLVIYQNDNGAIELPIDIKAETIWASQKQIAELFNVDIRTINEHLMNIFKSLELNEDSVIRNFRITATDGKKYNTKHYNLDAIISVGYRVNSKNATAFRKWATKTLRSYIIDGYAINPARIEYNKTQFQKAIEGMKLIASDADAVGSSEIADLVSSFADTWFSLDAYDKSTLPRKGNIKQVVQVGAADLQKELSRLRAQLIEQNEATDIFGQEREKNGLVALFGNVFQSFNGEDVYPSVEEKAAHLLYFVIKNHVFFDGNKRSGAYSFVWFLKEVNLLNIKEISPQALTAITLLIAESNPKDKDKMIGLVLLMLGVER